MVLQSCARGFCGRMLVTRLRWRAWERKASHARLELAADARASVRAEEPSARAEGSEARWHQAQLEAARGHSSAADLMHGLADFMHGLAEWTSAKSREASAPAEGASAQAEGRGGDDVPPTAEFINGLAELCRQHNIVAQSPSAQAEVASAQVEVTSAQAEVASAQAEVASAKAEFPSSKGRSPSSTARGRVGGNLLRLPSALTFEEGPIMACAQPREGPSATTEGTRTLERGPADPAAAGLMSTATSEQDWLAREPACMGDAWAAAESNRRDLEALREELREMAAWVRPHAETKELPSEAGEASMVAKGAPGRAQGTAAVDEGAWAPAVDPPSAMARTL